MSITSLFAKANEDVFFYHELQLSDNRGKRYGFD